LCGKSIEPLFSKAPLVETLLIAPLRPYSFIIFSEKIRAIDGWVLGLLRALGEIRGGIDNLLKTKVFIQFSVELYT
jgi:hypothetical protein